MFTQLKRITSRNETGMPSSQTHQITPILPCDGGFSSSRKNSNITKESNCWIQSMKLLFGIIIVLSVSACGEVDVRFECPEGATGEEWVWNGDACSLRRDGFNWSVSSIASSLDGSNDLYTLGSFTHFKNQAVKYVARLDNDGSLDMNFLSGIESFSPIIIVAATDGSESIYVGGILSHDFSYPSSIARLFRDGRLDVSFNAEGNMPGQLSTIVPANDGSGDVYVNGPIRLNNDGSVDTDFNSGISWGADNIAVAADGSGDIYVSRNVAPYIARLNNDGSIDTGFDTGASGFNNTVTYIAVATDGSGDVYVAGYFTEFNGTDTIGLARLNNDGSLDTEFVVNTRVYQAAQFIIPALDGSGDIYVHANNTNNQNIVRLNEDGSIDVGFGIGSKGINNSGSISDAAFATDGSGDIYVAGDFTHYNSMPVVNLFRLTADGDLVR